MARWEKEFERDGHDKSRKQDQVAGFLRRCERWDPEHEPFYFERSRWRRQRQNQREREEAADARDEQKEKEEIEQAKMEAEKFLKQQEEEMKKLAEQQRAAGVLLPGAVESGPLKLTIATKPKEDGEAAAAAAASAATATHAAAAAAGGPNAQPALPKKPILGAAEDEDDVQQRKKRLANITFTDPKTEAQLRVQKVEQQRKIRESLPHDWQGISALSPQWEFIHKAIKTDYRKMIDEQLVESLGESVPELVDAVVEKLTAKASASDVVAEVEPVLDEEAQPFVEKLWRTMIENSLFAAAGL